VLSCHSHSTLSSLAQNHWTHWIQAPLTYLQNSHNLSLRQPHSGTSSCIYDSPNSSPITSSFSDSPLFSSVTPSLFNCRLKTCLFHKSHPCSFTSSGTAFTDYCLERFLWATRFLSRLFDRVELIKSVSNVRQCIGPSVNKKFLRFLWNLVCRYKVMSSGPETVAKGVTKWEFLPIFALPFISSLQLIVDTSNLVCQLIISSPIQWMTNCP